MDKIVTENYIAQQLIYFLAGRRCCQQFACTLRLSERMILWNCARNLGVRIKVLEQGNQKCVKVYKQRCRHFLKEPILLVLTSATIAELYLLLSQNTFVCSNQDMQIIIQHFLPKPNLSFVSAHRLPLEPFKAHTPTQNGVALHYKYSPFEWQILAAMEKRNVLVLNSDASIEKLKALPLVILQHCERKELGCRIICVEHEQLVVIHKSVQLANHFGETVGETVAYQIPLQSHIGENTRIIYTTSQYFLRTLIGQLATESFRHISHLIVNDVHLHEAHTDILLSEIKSALNFFSNMKVILTAHADNTEEFMEYFKDAVALNLKSVDMVPQRQNIAFIGDIINIINSKAKFTESSFYSRRWRIDSSKAFNVNATHLDCSLEAYESIGTDAALKHFLYLIFYEAASIDYQHSVTGDTALNIAVRLNISNHVEVLLSMYANPYITNRADQNAFITAKMFGAKESLTELNKVRQVPYSIKYFNPAYMDYDMIIDLVNVLLDSSDWKPGNILIVVPTCNSMLRLNYLLLRYLLVGSLSQQISLHILHANMDYDQVESLIKESPKNSFKIIISTKIIESMISLPTVDYIIDTAREKIATYNAAHCCNEDVYMWLPKVRVNNRAQLVTKTDTNVTCFRLIPAEFYEMLDNKITPELTYMPLDRICLTIKLLSPYKMIAEYFNYVIATPPILNIHHTLQYLKKIDVLDDMEEVTWLGCRLIDVPLSCQSGRQLVFGILLQCLDPILTIVSFILTSNDEAMALLTSVQQDRSQSLKLHTDDNQYSDHFLLLRVYQDWQNNLNNECAPLYLENEQTFMLNGVMEMVGHMRSNIVGALRAAHLVHSQGPLCMNSINYKSSSLPNIRAALIGGLYPNVCVRDNVKGNVFKSANSKELIMHPNTAIKRLAEPYSSSNRKVSSPWIVFSRSEPCSGYNNISAASVVGTLTVALFAGPTKSICSNSNEVFLIDGINVLYIDEWIWIEVATSIVDIIMKTRQYFFSVYNNFLKYCCDSDKWRRNCSINEQMSKVVDVLSKIFQQEDLAAGFEIPKTIISRPKAISNRFLFAINSCFSEDQQQTVDNEDLQDKRKFSSLNTSDRYYFILKVSGDINEFYNNYCKTWLNNIIGVYVRALLRPNRQIFLILYNKQPDVLRSVARVKVVNSELTLQEYFRNNISISEIVDGVASMSVHFPTFNDRLLAFLIDKKVGQIILQAFAFASSDNWIGTLN